MDADFLVHDTYAMTRPQWKIATDLSEATMIFGEAVAQNYKTQDADSGRPMEADEEDAESSSSDEDEGEGLEDDAMPEVPEGDEEQESSDEAGSGEQAADSEESEDEQIFVSRQEEERDPAAEAEFDRELERLMADSVESRRFERKAIFDVPLPMKRAAREPGSEHLPEGSPALESGPEFAPGSASGSVSGSQMPANTDANTNTNTMAFSLMTKKGNKQQTRTIDLPSDSTFALAMRTQQQADREEQQRIKNLVLNYEKSTETENGDEC